ncbi:MAG: hypothetical protein IPJ77_21545 [Planctomycetes bacterium]|nr:hypothetical protein [Planctomycetota bacterium]
MRNTITNGPHWQLERVLARCEDSKQPNTSYIERLNLFIRRSLSYLHRRTNSMARRHRKLEEAVKAAAVLLQLRAAALGVAAQQSQEHEDAGDASWAGHAPAHAEGHLHVVRAAGEAAVARQPGGEA